MVNVAFQKCSIITARKRSLGQGNIFTPVCHSVHRGGIPACIAGSIPTCLAAGGRCAIPACIGEWGVLLLGVPGPGGAWSRGMPGLGGGSAPGGSAPGGPASRGVPGGDPPPGLLLLRAVRILLECILVCTIFHYRGNLRAFGNVMGIPLAILSNTAC